MVDVVIKPMQPTYTGRTSALQPRCSASDLQVLHLPRSCQFLEEDETQGVGPEYQVGS